MNGRETESDPRKQTWPLLAYSRNDYLARARSSILDLFDPLLAIVVASRFDVLWNDIRRFRLALV